MILMIECDLWNLSWCTAYSLLLDNKDNINNESKETTIKSGCKTCGPHGTYGRVAEQEDTYCEGFGSLLKCACRLVEGSMRKVQVLSSNVRSYLNIFQLITIHLNRLRTTFLFCSYNLQSTYDAAQEFIQEGFIYPQCRLLFALLPTGVL